MSTREELDAHLDAHGCGCPGRDRPQFCRFPERHAAAGGHAIPGFKHCPEAQRLWDALPHRPPVIG